MNKYDPIRIGPVGLFPLMKFASLRCLVNDQGERLLSKIDIHLLNWFGRIYEKLSKCPKLEMNFVTEHRTIIFNIALLKCHTNDYSRTQNH